MFDIVDRVAKAIAEYEAKGGHPFTTDQREIDRAIARAAIEAMREPTNKMVHAGLAYDQEVLPQGQNLMRGHYRAMIDAALK